MEDRSITYHADTNTYIVRKKAYFEDNISIDGNMIVGSGTNFWKGLKVSGTLELGKGSFIRNDLETGSAVIGPRSKIGGNVHASNDLTLLDDVTVTGSAICGGEMIVRPGCRIGFARADKWLELVGKVDIKSFESGTKVVVRSAE
ncbi:MAG: polymer-forming cytoskeletal protein [Euryarchaeota archaeon]|nr:polymer-forming cytoskeletal protein [Euryarchaeota archaeon]